MKIIISGREYAAVPLNKASLSQLLALKKSSGLGLDVLKEAATRYEDILRDESIPQDEKGVALLSDEQGLLSLAAMVFLSRWAAGDRLSFEEAADFPLDELSMEQEPGDEMPPAEDPLPARSGGSRAERRRPAGRTTSRSSTSSARSVSASSSSAGSGPA